MFFDWTILTYMSDANSSGSTKERSAVMYDMSLLRCFAAGNERRRYPVQPRQRQMSVGVERREGSGYHEERNERQERERAIKRGYHRKMKASYAAPPRPHLILTRRPRHPVIHRSARLPTRRPSHAAGLRD